MNMTALLIAFSASAAAGTPCPKELERRISPCTASQAEQDEIMKHIREGVAAHAKYEEAVHEEKRLRSDIFIWSSRAGCPL